MFEFRHQPLKGIYWTFISLSIVVRLPFWALACLVPAWRPRRSWSFARSLSVPIRQTFIATLFRTDLELVKEDPSVMVKKAGELGLVWLDGVPSEWIKGEVKEAADLNKVVPERLMGCWYGTRGEDGKAGQPAAPGEKVLYWLHGGAYTMGSAAPRTNLQLFPNLQQNEGIFPRIFAVDYRLTSAAPFKPENPFPAALIDALAGYRYLIQTLNFSPDNIVIGGDSAGGHLALCLARYIVLAEIPEIPQARGLLLLSPTLDWGNTHDNSPDCSMERNARTDFVRVILKCGYTARGLRGSLPEDAPMRNAWISPASLQLEKVDGMFKGLPPTCIVAAGAEHTLDCMRTGRDRIVHDIGKDKVRYLEYENIFHDFLVSKEEPERTMALKDLVQWYKDLFSSPSV